LWVSVFEKTEDSSALQANASRIDRPIVANQVKWFDA